MLSRTRQWARLALKGAIFDRLNLRELVDQRRTDKLEDAMGFRGQLAEHRRFQIAFLQEQGLKPSHRLLEIGCGPLTAAIPIIQHLEPGNYMGIDIRSSVLNLAWQEVGIAQLSVKNPRLLHSTSFAANEPLGQFDFVVSFSVLYHLSDDLLGSYFQQVASRLEPNGICLANVNVDLDSSTWLEFPFVKRSAEDYRSVSAGAGLHMRSLGTMRSLGLKSEWPDSNNEVLAFSR